MEKWLVPIDASPLPLARSVLALAPHPDDEIFGCGGALALYASQDDVAVHVHVLTDGAGYADTDQRVFIFSAREQESRQALAVISPRITVDFAGYEDRSLSQHSDLVLHIQQLLIKHAPQVVLLPSPWEVHPDHLALSRAAWAAVLLQHAGASAQRSSDESLGASLLFYEIGSPLKANMLVDITSVWTQKKAAMRCFGSQQEVQDYARHIEGLNNYRTYTLPAPVLQAEAFHHVASVDVARYACAQSEDLQNFSIDNIATLCINRWVEIVLHNASVHAENLQRALISANRQVQCMNETVRQRDQNLAAMSEKINNLTLQRDQNFAAMSEKINNLTLQRDQSLSVLAALEQRILAEQEQLKAVFNSTSWRITRPLRWIKQRFQKKL